LEVIREYALDTLGGDDDTEASVLKILWSRWHRELGELAMDVLGAPSAIVSASPGGRPPQTPPSASPGGRPPQTPPEADDAYDEWQRLFLFSRADTIYGGSDEIQRNIIASRALGLPREARP
ncbi:MAG TPA: acyl-CoA dehydrogenase family protein, partial [Polyangia bacterium]|nr:acyl-CoA dehydrogenase family protein [Polyangia bacterium]